MENYFHIIYIYILVKYKISQAMKKYYYEVPLLNLEGAPGVPVLNFKEGPGVQLLNFRGSQVPLLNFEGGPGFRVPGS